MDSPEKLLDKVKNRETFIAFVRALAEQRQTAEEMMRAKPEDYRWGSPFNWQNDDISQYLYACLMELERDEAKSPTWETFANFLYMGKIYE